jgi:hypothetical protein
MRMRNLILKHPESIYTFKLTFTHLEAGEMNGETAWQGSVYTLGVSDIYSNNCAEITLNVHYVPF